MMWPFKKRKPIVWTSETPPPVRRILVTREELYVDVYTRFDYRHNEDYDSSNLLSPVGYWRNIEVYLMEPEDEL